MAVTERSAAGDFVYTDVEFRLYRRGRAERLLRTGAVFLLAYAVAWSGVALARGDWATLTLQGVSFCGAAFVWFSVSRGRLGLASHAYFWIVVPAVVGLIALEGVSGPFRSMSHFHLLPLTLGAYLLFFEHSERGQRIYAGVCLVIFVSVELGLVVLPPLGLAYSADEQRTGRWILFFANFVSLLLVARLFLADLAEADRQLANANARLEALLENMLPPKISQRLRREGRTFADAFGACSVLFADIGAIRPWRSRCPTWSICWMPSFRASTTSPSRPVWKRSRPSATHTWLPRASPSRVPITQWRLQSWPCACRRRSRSFQGWKSASA